MVTKKVATINEITGELEDTGIVAFVPRKLKFGDFMFLMQEGLPALAKMDLTGDDLKAFLFILGNLDYENRFNMSQAEVARELGIMRQNCNKNFKKLVKEKLITKIDAKLYVVSDLYVWKGRLQDASPELKARGERAWKESKKSHKERIMEEQMRMH